MYTILFVTIIGTFIATLGVTIMGLLSISTGKTVDNDKSNLSCVPFFIIGSGRSGNTLLRSILSGSSDISIPPESYRLPFAIKKFH